MRRTLGVVGGVMLGIALSQFPEYAQQYTQRLGGAVDELRAIIEDFDRDAVAAGLTRRDALLRYEATEMSSFARRGTSMDRTFVRYAELSAALTQVQTPAAGSGQRCCQNSSTPTSARARSRTSSPRCR